MSVRCFTDMGEIDPAPGHKRKRTDDGPGGPLQPIDGNAIAFMPGTMPDETPNVVRGKINRLIESGEVKVGEFCETLGISQNAYRRFMNGNGKDGLKSDTYILAYQFFKDRESAGIKLPKKAKKSASEEDKAKIPDVSDIHLPGEENDAVQVYDTCNEIRRKIGLHLRKPGVTRAQFCRDLTAQFHTDKAPKQIQPSQLTRFMGQKGPDGGNTSSVFYAAYVYFEKLRIKEGKPKTKHREEMEKIWGPQGGFDTKRSHQQSFYFCGPGQRPYQDNYGRVTIH